MAEGQSTLTGLLGKKLGPVPVWLIGVLGVSGLAWYLHRAAQVKAAADAQAQNPGQNIASNLGASSLPDMFSMAYPMPYSSDVFVNITNPPSPITINNPERPAPIVTPAPTPAPPPPIPLPAVPLPPPPPKQTSITYVVHSGDTLWGIAQKFLGSGSRYPAIYQANAGTIEAVARQHGYSSSQGGHWIFPGETLVIPT